MSPQEMEFAKFIESLCKLKKEIERLIIDKQDPALKQEKVRKFL